MTKRRIKRGAFFAPPARVALIQTDIVYERYDDGEKAETG